MFYNFQFRTFRVYPIRDMAFCYKKTYLTQEAYFSTPRNQYLSKSQLRYRTERLSPSENLEKYSNFSAILDHLHLPM